MLLESSPVGCGARVADAAKSAVALAARKGAGDHAAPACAVATSGGRSDRGHDRPGRPPTRRAFEATFPTDPVDTLWRGEADKGAWLGEKPIDARGFSRIADLAVAASNDFALARGAGRRARYGQWQ